MHIETKFSKLHTNKTINRPTTTHIKTPKTLLTHTHTHYRYEISLHQPLAHNSIFTNYTEVSKVSDASSGYSPRDWRICCDRIFSTFFSFSFPFRLPSAIIGNIYQADGGLASTASWSVRKSLLSYIKHFPILTHQSGRIGPYTIVALCVLMEFMFY